LAEPSALVIEAEKAAIKTEGGPNAGGGWNLWSNGRVGQAIRCVAAGKFQVVVRAWGSVAGGVWPEMALLVDGLSVKTVSVSGGTRADYRFEADLKAGIHEIGVAFLNDALIGKEDRNLYLERFTILPPEGAASPTLIDDAGEWQAEMGKREEEIVAATRQAIERNRKSDAVVRVVDAAGKPVAGARISLTQTGHEFLFGCNIYGFAISAQALNAAYKERFAEMFNYATVGFYWRWYEEQRGKPNYEYTDKVVAWCVEHGVRMKGHPLLWGDEAGIPKWSNGQPPPADRQQRVKEILSDKHSWLPGGGMLRADMSPKPVYEELKKLIHQEWMTRTAGASNAGGQFSFRGFRGHYQVSVDVNGATVRKPFELGKGDRQELLISLGQ